MLGDSLNDLRFFFYQLEIPLLRRVFYEREEVSHVVKCPLKYRVDEFISQQANFAYLVDYLIYISFINDPQNARLNGFDANGTRGSFSKTFNRCDCVVFKEELKSDVCPIVIKPRPNTPLFNKKHLF